MSNTIAEYFATLKLKPDIASLKRVDRWFSLLEGKINKHSKRISSKMDSLGAMSTGGNVAKKKRDIDTIANAHVKAYDKELKALERRAHFENKERKAKEKYEDKMRKLQKADSHVYSYRKQAEKDRFRGYGVSNAVAKAREVRTKRLSDLQARSGEYAQLKNYFAKLEADSLKKQAQSVAKAEKALKYWNPTPAKQMSQRQIDAMYEAKARPFMQEIRAQDAMARLQSRALRENVAFDARRSRLTGGRPTLGAVGASRIFSAVAGAGIAGYGIGQLNKASQELEMLPVSMEAVTGSAAKAAQQLQFLADLGHKVGVTRMDIVPDFTKLLASARGTPLESKIQGGFSNFVRYSKVIGMSPEKLKLSLNAIQQMVNKGSMMAEEVKGQLNLADIKLI